MKIELTEPLMGMMVVIDRMARIGKNATLTSICRELDLREGCARQRIQSLADRGLVKRIGTGGKNSGKALTVFGHKVISSFREGKIKLLSSGPQPSRAPGRSVLKYLAARNAGTPVVSIADRYGVSRAAVYSALKRWEGYNVAREKKRPLGTR